MNVENPTNVRLILPPPFFTGFNSLTEILLCIFTVISD